MDEDWQGFFVGGGGGIRGGLTFSKYRFFCSRNSRREIKRKRNKSKLRIKIFWFVGTSTRLRKHTSELFFWLHEI